jgi:hypothetical protein
MSHIASFSGSYKPDDVHFLLKPIVMEMTPVDLKEELIQSGKMHYSDMLSQEPEPTRWHLDLFTRALDSGAARLAREVSHLARELARRAGDEPIVLVSLVRAGVPLGVMLHQALRAMGKQSFHYGISIIRDGVLMLRRLILSNHAMVQRALCLSTAGREKELLPANYHAH